MQNPGQNTLCTAFYARSAAEKEKGPETTVVVGPLPEAGVQRMRPSWLVISETWLKIERRSFMRSLIFL